MQEFPFFQVDANMLGEGPCFEKHQIAGCQVTLHNLNAMLGHLGCLSGEAHTEPVPIGDKHKAGTVHTFSGHATVAVSHIFPGLVLCVKF